LKDVNFFPRQLDRARNLGHWRRTLTNFFANKEICPVQKKRIPNRPTALTRDATLRDLWFDEWAVLRKYIWRLVHGPDFGSGDIEKCGDWGVTLSDFDDFNVLIDTKSALGGDDDYR
jgi:hypothetical protein